MVMFDKKNRNWEIWYYTPPPAKEIRVSSLCVAFEARRRMALDKGVLFIKKVKGSFKRTILNKDFECDTVKSSSHGKNRS